MHFPIFHDVKIISKAMKKNLHMLYKGVVLLSFFSSLRWRHDTSNAQNIHIKALRMEYVKE